METSPIISIEQNTEHREIFDVSLHINKSITESDALQIDFFLLPYSRKVSAKHVMLYPYQEYNRDIVNKNNSLYNQVILYSKSFFGILLLIIIFVVIYLINPQDIYSIQSIIALFAAYTIGKDMWSVIDDILVESSKGWRIIFQEQVFRYKLARKTRLLAYNTFAEKYRYGKESIKADNMDIVGQSNSHTLRLLFKQSTLKKVENKKVQLFSIHINPDVLSEFLEESALWGFKFVRQKKFLGFSKNTEFFQSINKTISGSLDEKSKWKKNSTFIVNTISISRFKIYLNSKQTKGTVLVAIRNTK